MTLDEFITSNPDPRELKRALAVKMRLEGMKHMKRFNPILGVASSYISRWQACYQEQGVNGLLLAYKGSKGYLSEEQRERMLLEWIQQKPQRPLCGGNRLH